jgi:hypothetical protein
MPLFQSTTILPPPTSPTKKRFYHGDANVHPKDSESTHNFKENRTDASRNTDANSTTMTTAPDSPSTITSAMACSEASSYCTMMIDNASPQFEADHVTDTASSIRTS